MLPGDQPWMLVAREHRMAAPAGCNLSRDGTLGGMVLWQLV